MKKEILQSLEHEVKACRHFTLNANRKAEEGKIGAAISMLDIAQIAETCAMQAHDRLWEVRKGKLNDIEFELFSAAKVLRKGIREVCQVIKQAIKTQEYTTHGRKAQEKIRIASTRPR